MLTWEGQRKIGRQYPQKTSATIKHELAFIEQMNYAAYFLTVHDIVRFARQQNILCQGRVLLPIPLFAIAWVLHQ